jgi:hypothetical protein
MAIENNTPFPMGQAELEALANRIRARAQSTFFSGQPVQQLDMLACAAAIDELVRVRREILHIADATREEETEMALRALAAGSAS